MDMKNHRHKLPAVSLATAMLLALSSPVSAQASSIDTTYLDGKPAVTYAAKVGDTLPEIASPRFACMNEKGEVFYNRGGYEPVKIASVTKMMTAIIAADYAMNSTLVVSEHAASIPGSSANLKAGDEGTFYDILQGLMLPSGNDAAYALAEDIGGRLLKTDKAPNWETASVDDKVARFVEEMNKRADKLGLEHTIFTNPCGLDDEGFEGEHVSCAADIAIMSRELLKSPALAEIVLKPQADMLVRRGGVDTVIPVVNTDKLLLERADARGVKTGFTDAAGACFAGAVDIDGDIYYTSVLGAADADVTFADTAALWDWIRMAKETESLFSGLSQTSDGDYVVAQLGAPEWTDKVFPVTVDLEPAMERWYWEDVQSVTLETDVPESGVIPKGTVVGTLYIHDESGQVIDEVDAVAAETVPLPGIWERIGVFFTRLFAPFTGARTQASDIYYDMVPVVNKMYTAF